MAWSSRSADCFDEQDRPGLGDDLTAVILNADTGIGPDRVLHLGSASGGAGTRTSTILILAGQRHFLLSCPPAGQPAS